MTTPTPLAGHPSTCVATATAPERTHGAGTAVLHELAAGDLTRIDWFVNAHKDPLLRYLNHQIRDPHAAEDVAQDVFLRAIRAARDGTFDGRSSVRTWLFQIARHCVIDRARQTRVRVARPLDEASARVSDAPDPLSRVLAAEAEERVDALLGKLPSAQAEVLSLKVLGGLTSLEIARLTDQPIETVKSRLRYALEKVHALLVSEREPGHD